MMRITILSLAIAICLSIGHADAQNISDEAMHYFDRGQAAVELAKTPADYEDAVREFEQAVRLAPGWADAYYNLGLIEEKLGKYDDASKSLTKYLELSPDARDSREVKKLIAKIEYKQEKASKQELLNFQLYWAALGVDTTIKDEHDGTTRRVVGNTRTVRELLAKGADPNAKNDFGVTALKAAKNAETVKVLLDYGADVNVKDSDGDSVLMYRENAETVRELLAHGADPNSKNNKGNTPLMTAANTGVIKVLLANGADIDAKNNEGDTVLLKAVFRGDIKTIKVLLANGADVNAQDNLGLTAWKFTRSSSGSPEVARLLKQAGARE